MQLGSVGPSRRAFVGDSGVADTLRLAGIVASHDEVSRNIDRLERMIPSELFGRHEWDFGKLWGQIKKTGASFKGTRFPTRDDHQAAWSRFQELVDQVKAKQEQQREASGRKLESSAALRDGLIRRAENALPDSGLGDVILAIATGGLSAIVEGALESLLGPYDKRREELLRASRALKAVWDEFTSRKRELLGSDRKTVFQALKDVQDRLDDLWAKYKAERKEALDTYYGEKRRRHEEWRRRTLANVRKNQERLSRLESVLDHKRRHLESIYDRLADARSDNYRSRVQGWIAEEEGAIRDIEAKTQQIKEWIDEDLGRLDS